MKQDEKLTEECALAMIEAYGIEADAPSMGRDSRTRTAIENRKIELRAVIPLVQAALLREMNQNLEGRHWVYREQIVGWLHAFATAKGFDIGKA